MIFFSNQQCCWLAIALFTCVEAANIKLLDILSRTPELSTLYGYVNSTNLTNFFADANEFTFLAPSNNAIATYVKANPDVLTKDVLIATLQYSLLKGIFPSLSFTNTSQFVPSNLLNTTYANVTGGQRVELVISSKGYPQVITGTETVSISTSADLVCLGGLIHIIDTVPQVPIAAVIEISEIPLEYFVSILNNGGYLNPANAGYVGEVLSEADVTYFIPNTPSALANFTSLAKTANASELQAVFQYHFVPGVAAYSSQLKTGMSLRTAQGSNVSITLQGGEIYVNAARVIASDYLVANGVVHVIDNFLDRRNTAGPPAPTGTTAAISPTATPASTASPTTTTAANSKTTSTTTIGIAVGVSIAGIAIIGASIWFIIRSRKKKNTNPGVWDQSISNAGKFYVTRGGQVKRQEDLGLGLQSTGMHEVGSMKSYGETNSSRPQS